MSSRREVLLRIRALLQRKTLLETKNRKLKCLKRHYSNVQSMKNVVPNPGDLTARVPTPGNLPSKEKNADARVQPGGRGGAAGID